MNNPYCVLMRSLYRHSYPKISEIFRLINQKRFSKNDIIQLVSRNSGNLELLVIWLPIPNSATKIPKFEGQLTVVDLWEYATIRSWRRCKENMYGGVKKLVGSNCQICVLFDDRFCPVRFKTIVYTRNSICIQKMGGPCDFSERNSGEFPKCDVVG